MYDLVGVTGDELLGELISLEAFASGDLGGLTMLAGLLHNITECVNIKIEGVATEDELVSKSQSLSQKNKLLAGQFWFDMHQRLQILR